MGKNPCPICATPGAVYAAGQIFCIGCGLNTRITSLAAYLRQTRKLITFEKATEMYERADPMVSFGQWLITRNLELVAKP